MLIDAVALWRTTIRAARKLRKSWHQKLAKLSRLSLPFTRSISKATKADKIKCALISISLRLADSIVQPSANLLVKSINWRYGSVHNLTVPGRSSLDPQASY